MRPFALNTKTVVTDTNHNTPSFILNSIINIVNDDIMPDLVDDFKDNVNAVSTIKTSKTVLKLDEQI